MRLCDWLFRAILLDCHVLNYASAYFQLGPIELRIYEVARSTFEGEEINLNLATFRLQIGYQNPLANFRNAPKQIAGTDVMPDYRLELVEGVGEAGGGQGKGRKASPTRVLITRRPPAIEADAGPSPKSDPESSADSNSEAPAATA